MTFMIPRIAHFVWVGDELPFTEVGNIVRFHMIHREWEVMVWNERDAIGLMTDKEKRVCQQIEIAIHKANLIRFLALREYGGVYMDLDILVLKNLEEVLDPDRLTLSNVWLDHWGDHDGNRRSYNNCFASAPEKDPVMVEICDAIVENMDEFVEMQTMQIENVGKSPAIIHGASHNWKRPKRPFEVIC